MEEIKAEELKMREINGKSLWAGDRSFIAALIAYMAVLVLFSGLRVISGLGWLDNLDAEVVDIGFSAVSQILIMLLVPLAVMKFVSRQTFKKTFTDFGFGRTSAKVIGFAFLLGLMLYFLNMFVANISHVILTLVGYRFPTGASTFDTGIAGLLISLVLIGVLPGLCEESCHRGLLLQSFRSRFGIWRAVLISSLLFGLMHLNVVQVFYAAVLGYLMALAVVATRSIWTGVIMHFCNNAISVFLSFASKYNWVFADILQQFLNLFSGPLALFLMAGFIYLMFWLIMRVIHMFAKDNYRKNERLYLARFVHANPEFIKARAERGESISLEDMSATVRQYVEGLNQKDAVKFYLDDHTPRRRTTAAEKTLLAGIIFFGTLVTAFTFVWGML